MAARGRPSLVLRHTATARMYVTHKTYGYGRYPRAKRVTTLMSNTRRSLELGQRQRLRLKSVAQALQTQGFNRKSSRQMAWSKRMRQELKAYEGDLATYAQEQEA